MARVNEAEMIERLKAIHLFENLSEESLQRIATMMQEFDAPVGRVLVQPRMPGSGLFIIEEGEVTIKSPTVEMTRGPGECIGELALLTDEGHAARVTAKTPIRGFAISRTDFKEMLGDNPQIALSLLEILASRLTEALHK